MHESKKSEKSDRLQEDQDFLRNLMETKMNLDPELIKVNKLVRLGKREIRTDGTINKCRPLRFTVMIFYHKRPILKANSLLRSYTDVIFSNIYFTPDLTKNQKKLAFELRSELRKKGKPKPGKNCGCERQKLERLMLLVAVALHCSVHKRRDYISPWSVITYRKLKQRIDY